MTIIALTIVFSQSKQGRFWAMHVNWKWNFCILGRKFCPHFRQIVSIREKTFRHSNFDTSGGFTSGWRASLKNAFAWANASPHSLSIIAVFPSYISLPCLHSLNPWNSINSKESEGDPAGWNQHREKTLRGKFCSGDSDGPIKSETFRIVRQNQLAIFTMTTFDSSSETQGRSVGPGEKARQKFSSTGPSDCPLGLRGYIWLKLPDFFSLLLSYSDLLIPATFEKNSLNFLKNNKLRYSGSRSKMMSSCNCLIARPQTAGC